MGHMEFDFVHDDSDVLMRMKNENGMELTFITAPSTVFSDREELGPIITGFGDQIIVAFNQERIEQLIDESIEKNAETYGEAQAAFLPVGLVLRKGMEAAERYMKNNDI